MTAILFEANITFLIDYLAKGKNITGEIVAIGSN